ncbi:MAG: N-acetylmuramic acid 6-phosphate etherase [Planctomycetota bacterium]
MDVPDMNLPPDRSHVPTEGRLPEATGSDALPTADFLLLMSDQDAVAAAAVRKAVPQIAAFVDAIVPRFKDNGRVFYAGAGTSGRLGVLDASECPPTFDVEPGRVVGIIAGGTSALTVSSEGLEDDRRGIADVFGRFDLTDRDTVLGITAGGTTPYALGAIELGAEKGCLTGLLTCGIVPDEPKPDHVLHLQTGPEVLVGSTRLKAGTATKLALNMISTGLMVRMNKTHDDLMVDLRATNDKLEDRAARILMWMLDLSRDDAFRMLEAGEGRVKTAIVMATKGVDFLEAEDLLDETEGNLRKAIA